MRKSFYTTLISFVLIMILVVGTIATSLPAMRFSDVITTDWFYNSVRYVFDNGIMKGVSNKEFKPYDKLSRSMAVTVLYRESLRYDDYTAGQSDVPFDDIKPCWYYDAVVWAYNKGIIKGKTANSFAPDDFVTRAEFATMLYRYANSTGTELVVKREGEPKDLDSVPNYALSAVKAMYQMEIINGKENNCFDPLAYIYRAEAAAMISRYSSCKKATESGKDEKEDIIIEIPESQAMPNFENIVNNSEIIVRGEVKELFFEGHTNPSGKSINELGEIVPLGNIKQYMLKVDDVIKGNVKIGDIIVVNTVLVTGIGYEDSLKYNIITSQEPFDLHIGENGIFCLIADDINVEKDSGKSYYVVGSNYGVFADNDDGTFSNSKFIKAIEDFKK